MKYLVISILLLMVSPFAHTYMHQKGQKVRKFLYLALSAGIIYFSFFHVMPVAWKMVGIKSLYFFAAGLVFVWVTESVTGRVFAHAQKSVKLISLLVSALGVTIHAVLDGSTIALAENYLAEDSKSALALITLVLLHQIPVGIFMWHTFLRDYSVLAGWVLIVTMSCATAIGYFGAGFTLSSFFYQDHFAYLQAFVVGSLIHLVFEPHLK